MAFEPPKISVPELTFSPFPALEPKPVSVTVLPAVALKVGCVLLSTSIAPMLVVGTSLTVKLPPLLNTALSLAEGMPFGVQFVAVVQLPLVVFQV